MTQRQRYAGTIVKLTIGYFTRHVYYGDVDIMQLINSFYFIHYYYYYHYYFFSLFYHYHHYYSPSNDCH